MFSQKLTTSIAIGIAAIAVSIAAYTVVSPSPSTAASGAADAANQTAVGQVPPDWQSGSGTIVTGVAADQAKAVAVAAYPGGTVNRVLLLPDGSYAVHQINIDWPHHVFVSAAFEVTGAIG
jgi:hypothetical protein